MSDTTETADVQPPALASLKITPVGDEKGTLSAVWGEPARSIEVQPMDLGQQFDLAELTGPNAANAVWVSMATVAASVRAIDGIPVPQGAYTRERIKATLNKMGLDGLRAGMMALNGYRGPGEAEPTEADMKAAVGN